MKKSHLLFKVIAIIIPSIFFFFTGNIWANSEPLKEWHEWEPQQNVPLHKTWSIKFNQVVDEESLHNESIFIENTRLEKIESKISLDETGKIVRIEPPTEGYQSDETYTLYITSTIESLDEKLLKKPIKMRFSTLSATPPFEPRENSSNTVDVKDVVKEVDETSILSITDSTVQVKEEDAGQLKTGDIFFLPATYESPFGQARQVTEKITEGDNVTVSTEKPELEEIVSDMDLSQTIPISADQFIINPELLDDSSSNEFNTLSNGGCQKKGSIEICDLKNGGVSINLKDLKLKKLHTTLNGSLELIAPHVNVDIESGKILGIPYKFKFNRLEFATEENLNFHLHSELSGSKTETIKLASAPVPFAGFPKAGVNVVILLTVSANGKVSLDYTFEQSFTAKIGVQNNEETEKLEPFKKVDFNLDHDLNLEGEANLDLSLESGVYVLIGDISITDLTLTIDFDNNLKGKMVDLSKDDRFNPSGCYRFESQLNALGKFSFGEEIDTKWFGKIGYEYETDLFKMNLFNGELGNCSYDSLQLLPNVKSLEPGEEGVFKVRGNVQNFDRTLKNLTIPSDYVTFKTKNNDLIKINENGDFQVNPDAKHGDRLSIEVAYSDPISGKIVSYDLDVEVRERFLEFRSELLGYSMLVESRALESMKVKEGTVDGKEHGSYLATAFFRHDGSIKDEDVFVGGISRYTHKQWKNYYSTLPDRHKIAETDYWIYAYSEPEEHPYKGEFLGEYSPTAIKYTNTQKKLIQSTRTLKVFTEDVPEIDPSYQIVDISIGDWLNTGHLILKPDASVWAFGMNHTGGLGLGPEFITEYFYMEVEQPQRITNLPPIKKVVSQGYYTLALTTDGNVYRWKKHLSRYDHEIPENYRPYLVEDLSNVIDIAASSDAEYYLKEDGTVWMYGDYGFNNFTSEPIPLTGITDVKKIFNGGAVLKSDGIVWIPTFVKTSGGIKIRWEQYEDFKDVVWYDGERFSIKKDGTILDKGRPIEGLSNAAKISGDTILLRDGTVMRILYGEEYSNHKRFSEYQPDSHVIKVKGLENIVDITQTKAIDEFGNIWSIRRDISTGLPVIEPI